MLVVLKQPISSASYTRLYTNSTDPAEHTDLVSDPALSS